MLLAAKEILLPTYDEEEEEEAEESTFVGDIFDVVDDDDGVLGDMFDAEDSMLLGDMLGADVDDIIDESCSLAVSIFKDVGKTKSRIMYDYR